MNKEHRVSVLFWYKHSLTATITLTSLCFLSINSPSPFWKLQTGHRLFLFFWQSFATKMPSIGIKYKLIQICNSQCIIRSKLMRRWKMFSVFLNCAAQMLFLDFRSVCDIPTLNSFIYSAKTSNRVQFIKRVIKVW